MLFWLQANEGGTSLTSSTVSCRSCSRETDWPRLAVLARQDTTSRGKLKYFNSSVKAMGDLSVDAQQKHCAEASWAGSFLSWWWCPQGRRDLKHLSFAVANPSPPCSCKNTRVVALPLDLTTASAVAVKSRLLISIIQTRIPVCKSPEFQMWLQ